MSHIPYHLREPERVCEHDAGDLIMSAIHEAHGADIAQDIENWLVIGEFNSSYWHIHDRANLEAIARALDETYGNTRYFTVDISSVGGPEWAYLIVNSEHPDAVGLARELWQRHCINEAIDADRPDELLLDMAEDDWKELEFGQRIALLACAGLSVALAFSRPNDEPPELPAALLPVFAEKFEEYAMNG